MLAVTHILIPPLMAIRLFYTTKHCHDFNYRYIDFQILPSIVIIQNLIETREKNYSRRRRLCRCVFPTTIAAATEGKFLRRRKMQRSRERSPFEALQLTSSRSFGVAFYFACNFSDVATVVDHTRRDTYAYCYHEHSVIYLGNLLAYGIRLGSS